VCCMHKPLAARHSTRYQGMGVCGLVVVPTDSRAADTIF
jgi:hypothetical protein